MLCQICKAKPATIHIQEFVDGEKRSLHLCAECARKRAGLENPFDDPHLQEMLERLSQTIAENAGLAFGGNRPDPSEKPPEPPNVVCPTCGLETQTFLKTGLLGCPDCYDAFAEFLAQDLPLKQHGMIHRGRAPLEHETQIPDPQLSERVFRRKELEKLRKSLDESVRREEYELAAELRDRIAELERELGSVRKTKPAANGKERKDADA